MHYEEIRIVNQNRGTNFYRYDKTVYMASVYTARY